MDLELTGKVVLVAGASRGIGLAIAAAFLGEGCQVTLAARDGNALDAAAEKLENAAPQRVRTVVADLSDPRAIDQVAADQSESTDIIIINYGATDTAPGYDTDDETWQRLMAANLNGPARLARTFAAAMAKRGGGVILIVGSIAGKEAIGAPIAYTAAKSGLRAVTKTMARELGRDGVRVNLLSPGNVIFSGGRWAAKRDVDPQKIDAMLDATVPMGRFGTPEEIADFAVFMCSPRASFMTGADVVIDGGQTVTF